ncbi:MAG: hypothetical protein RJA66_896 [Actinomycetota bacterium]
MFSRVKFVLAAVLALFITAGMMPSQAFAAVVRDVYIVQTTAAGQDSVMKAIFGFGEVPLDQLDLVLDGFTVPLTDYEASVLAANPDVINIQLDQKMSLLETQTPTPSWGLDRIDQQTNAYDSTYNYPTDGGKGVRVYIVDTGVMATNPEFEGRILPGFDALGENLQSADCHGHGTHVAGTVAGTKFGVAKAATIVPVRVLGCSGSGSTSGILKALDWILANNPAGTPALVSMSIGGGKQPLFNDGIKKLYDGGILPIVAAGNSNADACNYSPSSTPDAVTVGASDSSDNRASYSNFGDCVDLFAPGSSIVSASATNPAGSTTMSGTSMATPHVSGLAALYLGQNPTATPAQVAKAIRDNGIVNGINNAQSQYGNILINNNFVRGAAPIAPNPNPVLNAPDQVASVAVTATGSNSGTVSWVDGPSDGGSPVTGHVVRALASGALVANANAVLGANVRSYTINGLDANTTYTFSVYAYNAIGSGKVSAGVVAKTAVGAPAAPVSLAVQPAATTAAVTWAQANDGGSPVTYNTIELYSASTGKWAVAGTSTATSFTLTGLASGANYIARVKATNALGTGVVSRSVSFATLAGAPDVPTGLTSPTIGANSATVAWNPVTSTTPGAVVSYVVSYGIVGGTVQYVNSATPNVELSPLAPGRTYSFTVRSQIGTVSSGESAAATFTTLATIPGAPAGVTVTNVSGSQVLSWYSTDDGGSPITGYVIETSGPLTSSTATVGSWTVFAEQTSTSINIPAAPVAKYVRYRVIAKNFLGSSLPSLNVVVTTAPGRPTAPTGLRASEPNSAGQTTLTWVAPASDGGSALTGFTIISSRDGRTWQTLSNVTAATLSYVTPKPTKGQTWSYAVYARNAAGISPNSDSVSLTTETTAPSVVNGLSAILSGTDELTVRWAGVSDNGGLAITGYALETLVNGVWTPAATLPANSLTYVVKRGAPGVVSSFRITASNSLGAGPVSSVASIMSPYLQASAPQGFTAAFNGSTNRVDVGFSAPSDLGGGVVNYYSLQVTKDAGRTWVNLVSLTPTTLRYAATAPLKGQTWSYRVVALTNFGAGVPSSTVEIAIANTAPGSMNAPSVALTGTADLTVRWAPVADNGGLAVTYNLERQVDGVWSSVAQLPATTLAYTTTRPAPGVIAVFRISAANSIGAGPTSASSSAMTPYVKASAPQNFTATLNSTTNRVDVSFLAPSDLGGGAVRNYYLQTSADDGKTWINQVSTSATALAGALAAPAKGKTVSYRAIAYTQFGLGEPSNAVALVTAATAPSQVASASVSLTGSTDVTLRWNAPYDFGGSALTGYSLERQVDGVWGVVASLAPNVQTYTVARPAPGVFATFRVTAVNGIGTGPVSGIVSVMSPYLQASAPQNLTAVFNTVSQRVDVTFVAPTNLGGGKISSYLIQVSKDAGQTWLSLTSVSATGVAAATTAPTKGQTWSYRAIAYTQFGAGLPSAAVAVAVATAVPAAPSVSGVSLTTSGAIQLRWYAPSDNGGIVISGYRVQKQTGSTWTDVTTTSALTVEVPAEQPGVRGYWRVLAVNSLGASAASSSLSYALPAIKSSAVQNPVIVAGSAAGTAQLTYAAPIANGGSAISSFYTYVSRDAGVTWALISATTALSVRVQAPARGVTWQYKVAAVTAAGVGEFSSVVSYTGN